MKKLIITSALFAFAAAPVFAQSTKVSAAPSQGTSNNAAPRPPMAEKLAERQAKTYQQQYQLTPKQYDGVYNVCLNFAKTMDAKRAEGKQITPAEFQVALAKKNEGMKAVMTPEQYKAYDATLNHSAPQRTSEKAVQKN